MDGLMDVLAAGEGVGRGVIGLRVVVWGCYSQVFPSAYAATFIPVFCCASVSSTICAM